MRSRRREDEQEILDRIKGWARAENADWTDDEWTRLMRKAQSQALVPARTAAGAWLRPVFTAAAVLLALVAGALFLRQGSAPGAGRVIDARAGEMLPADPRLLVPGQEDGARAAGLPLAVDVYESGAAVPLGSALLRTVPGVESRTVLGKNGLFELTVVCEPPNAEAPGSVRAHLTLHRAKRTGASGVLLSVTIPLEIGRKTVVGVFRDDGRSLELAVTAGRLP